MSALTNRFGAWNQQCVVSDTGSPAEGRIVRSMRDIATWPTKRVRAVITGLGVAIAITGGLQNAVKPVPTAKYVVSTFNTLAIMALAIVVLGRWVRVSAHTMRRVACVSAVLLGIIILTGAAVRLTGSGLGCTDWPTCNNGSVTPSIGDGHALIEFGNRVVTGLCVLAAGVGVLSTLVRVPYRRDLARPAVVVVVAIMGNAVLGGLMVQKALPPTFVLTHFLLAIAALAAGVLLVHRSGEDAPTAALFGSGRRARFGSQETWLGRVLTISALMTLFVGTLVTGSGPHAGDDEAKRLGFIMKTMAEIHSGFAWVSLVSVLLLARAAWRGAYHSEAAELRKRLQVLLFVILFQGAIGYTQWFLQVPAKLVMLHVVGAVAYWTGVLWVRAALSIPPLVEAVTAAKVRFEPATV
jgi:heme a synthase